MSSQVRDCPCDVGPCPNRSSCGRQALECKAVKQYYEKGWYRTSLVGVNLKPMKMRKA